MFSQPRIPVRNPLSPGEGFDAARARGNALTKQAMENRLLESQGNLAQQQAAYLPYSKATNALSNPSLWMTDKGAETGKNLVNTLPDLIKQGQNFGGLDSRSIGGMILGKIFPNIFGQGNNSPQGGQPNAMAQGGQQKQGGQGGNTMPSAPNGVPNTPAAIAAQQNSGGLNVDPNPIQTQETNAEAQKAAVLGQTNAQNAQWDESNRRVANGARTASQLRNFAKEFHSNYKKAHYTGARFGESDTKGLKAAPTWPGEDLSPDQLADKASAQLVGIMGPNLQPGGDSHITDSNYDLVKNSKLERSLEPKAEKQMYDYTLAVADRMDQEQNFQNEITNKYPNMTPKLRDTIWSAYQKSAPPYDFENGKVVPENNSAKAWKQFLTPEAIHSFMQGEDYIPPKDSGVNVNKVQNSSSDSNSNAKETNKIQHDGDPLESIPHSNAGARALSKKMELPDSVTDDASFQEWYNKQEPLVQHAADLKWRHEK